MSLVTIILTTLNSEKYLARSIDSCLRQTHRDIELLVVDGGSQDRTLEIVAAYDDPRVRLIHQPANSGKLPGAINLGMENARGEFITWTQDDCWYEDDAIQIMLEYLQTFPEVAFVYTDHWDVNAAGEERKYHPVAPLARSVETDVLGICFLFRRQVYEVIGPQEVEYFYVHEVPWRFKVARRFRIEPLHLPLLYYTVHTDSLTGRLGPWTVQRKAIEVIFQDGIIDQKEYERRVAQNYIDQAYDEFILQGNYGAFWKCVLSGIRGDPGHLRNRGLLKLMLRSLWLGRGAYRAGLLSRWSQEEAERQRQLIAEASARRAQYEAKGFAGW